MSLHPYYKKDIVALALKTQLRTPINQLTKVNMGGNNYPAWIVIHFVGAAGQAKDNGNYFEYTYREASAHKFIDPNITVRVVPDNRVAWHVGDGAYSGKGTANGYYLAGKATNNNSVGLEGCQDTSTGENVWKWQFHINTYIQLILETIAYQEKYGLGDDRVVRHNDVSGKICPGNWQWDNWFMWHQFKKDLAAVKAAKKSKPIDVTPVRPDTKPDDSKPVVPDMYLIKHGDTLWKIANSHKVTVQNLRDWNNIKGDLIFPETKIHVKNPANTKPVVQGITQLGKKIPTSGWYQFIEKVNVREGSSASGPILAQYQPGDKVKFFEVIEANGYIWLKYRRNVGGIGYVSAGTKNIPYGKFV